MVWKCAPHLAVSGRSMRWATTCLLARSLRPGGDDPALAHPRAATRTILDPVYPHSNPIFFQGGLQSTIIIFAKTNPFLPAVRDYEVMRANGGRAVITGGGEGARRVWRAAPAQLLRADSPQPVIPKHCGHDCYQLWHHNYYRSFNVQFHVLDGQFCAIVVKHGGTSSDGGIWLRICMWNAAQTRLDLFRLWNLWLVTWSCLVAPKLLLSILTTRFKTYYTFLFDPV